MYTYIMKKILLTCPPMLKQFERYKEFAIENGLDVYCAPVTQIMTEDELIELVPQFDGWIIGDDPATREVFTAGKAGQLKAAVKWGIGHVRITNGKLRAYFTHQRPGLRQNLCDN